MRCRIRSSHRRRPPRPCRACTGITVIVARAETAAAAATSGAADRAAATTAATDQRHRDRGDARPGREGGRPRGRVGRREHGAHARGRGCRAHQRFDDERRGPRHRSGGGRTLDESAATQAAFGRAGAFRFFVGVLHRGLPADGRSESLPESSRHVADPFWSRTSATTGTNLAFGRNRGAQVRRSTVRTTKRVAPREHSR